jgi:type VI secretion system secreted protein Hcp
MADEFYVTVEGARQGKFAGETAREAHQGKLPGIAFHYGVASARDAASGMASGRRTHHPVVLTKQWGASSPQFFAALCTNESLKSVLFEFMSTDPSGEEYVFHTVRLTNAGVSEVEQFIEESSGPGESHEPRALERISLVFQRIEIENKDGNTMAVDDARQR